jgi:SPX domain protein involved in polyphosphate accumulation
MKFGKYLLENREPEWESSYVDYNYLKKVIKSLEAVQPISPSATMATSLSIPRPTNAAGVPMSKLTQESFYKLLEDEMKKIEQFTQLIVSFLFLLIRFSFMTLSSPIPNPDQ